MIKNKILLSSLIISSLSISLMANDLEKKETIEEVKNNINLVEFKPLGLNTENEISKDSFNVEQNDKIYAIGQYSGKKIGYSFDKSGHEGTYTNVIVNSKEPIYLMLGNYEPTVWNIGWTKDSKIKGIILGGYHTQKVMGIPKSLKVKNLKGKFYVSNERRDLIKLKKISDKYFNKKIDLVYSDRYKDTFIVGNKIKNEQILTSNEIQLKDIIKKNEKNLSGKWGLEQAIKDGYLRKGNKNDGELWLKNYLKNQKVINGDLPPVSTKETVNKNKIYPRYIIIKDGFKIPSGLYGANSTTFLLKSGIKIPSGKIQHSRLYIEENGTCEGTVCQMHHQ